MITNFKIKDRLCKKHNLPEAFICLNKSCSIHSFLCSTCIKKDHHHLSNVYSMKTFIQYFSDFLLKAKERYEEDRCEVNISNIIKAKRQEVEQLHLELVEKIMKRLSDEKKIICQGLELMEKEYKEKEILLKKNQEQRQETINYLLPYSQQAELLELKLKTSSGWALTRLKEHLFELEQLTNSFDKGCFLALQASAISEFNQKLQGTFFKNINKFIKEQSILIKPPLPDRIYSFSRRTGIHQCRPCSSFQKRAQSNETGSTKAVSARQL